MLDAKIPGAPASKSAKDADPGGDVGIVLPSRVRPLHGEVPGAGGCSRTWIKLEEAGIHGNGHMMMLEKNNQEIAAVMSRWMEKMMPTAAKSKTSKPA